VRKQKKKNTQNWRKFLIAPGGIRRVRAASENMLRNNAGNERIKAKRAVSFVMLFVFLENPVRLTGQTRPEKKGGFRAESER
jgi:hypothetical protein